MIHEVLWSVVLATLRFPDHWSKEESAVHIITDRHVGDSSYSSDSNCRFADHVLLLSAKRCGFQSGRQR